MKKSQQNSIEKYKNNEEKVNSLFYLNENSNINVINRWEIWIVIIECDLFFLFLFIFLEERFKLQRTMGMKAELIFEQMISHLLSVICILYSMSLYK